MGLKGTESILLQLGTLLFTALLLGSLMERFGFPAILGYTLTGLILGPEGLNIVKESELISGLAELGMLLLLFYIGMEFNVKKLKGAGYYALILSPIRTALALGLGFTLGKLLGFSDMASLVIGASIAVSSTGIITNTIIEKRIHSRLESQVVTAMLILEDIFSVFFIAFLLGSAAGGDVIRGFIHTLMVVTLLFAIGPKLSSWFFTFIKKFGHERHLGLYALGLIIFFSYGITYLGVSPLIGAFFAGVVLAESTSVKKIERELETLRKILVLVFFTSLGLYYSVTFSLSTILLAALMLVAHILVLASLKIVSPFIGIPLRTSVRMFALDVPLGEFSLFFAATAQLAGIPRSDEIMGAVFILVFVTTLLSRYLMKHEHRIFHALKRILPRFLEAEKMRFFVERRPVIRESAEVWNLLKRTAQSAIAILFVVYLTGYTYTTLFPSPLVWLGGLLLILYPLIVFVRTLAQLLFIFMEDVIASAHPRMDPLKRRVFVRRVSLFVAGAFIMSLSLLLSVLSQYLDVLTFQLASLLFIVSSLVVMTWAALRIIGFFLER